MGRHSSLFPILLLSFSPLSISYAYRPFICGAFCLRNCPAAPPPPPFAFSVVGVALVAWHSMDCLVSYGQTPALQ